MELTQRPEVRQRVVLSPQVYQGLSILSMPIAELEILIDRELLENPVLETDEFDDEPPEQDDPRDAESDAEEQAAWDEWLDQYQDLADSEPVVPRDPEPQDVNTEDFVGGVTTFDDYLLGQLTMVDLEPAVERAARAVIGSLDDDGFFVGDLDEIASVAEVSPEEAALGLAAVQELDPPGVGARDTREALLSQKAFLGIEDPVLRDIITDHLTRKLEDSFHHFMVWKHVLQRPSANHLIKCTPVCTVVDV